MRDRRINNQHDGKAVVSGKTFQMNSKSWTLCESLQISGPECAIRKVSNYVYSTQ